MESAYDTFAPRHVPVVPLRQAQIEKQVNEAREAKQFYDELRQRLFAQGAQEYKGAKHLVNRFDYEELIVRREDPLRIEGLLDEGELIISTEGKGYVNATRWD